MVAGHPDRDPNDIDLTNLFKFKQQLKELEDNGMLEKKKQMKFQPAMIKKKNTSEDFYNLTEDKKQIRKVITMS